MLWGIFGAGGCGRGVLPLARRQLIASEDELVFVDDWLAGAKVNGQKVLSFGDFLTEHADDKAVSVAVADPISRKKIVRMCEEADLTFLEVRARDVVEMDNVTIGAGAILSPGAVITSNVSIGAHFHCNIQSYVEHDCVIGDYVTFAPGVRCNGNVHIGDGAYIGSGAIIRQGTSEKPLKIGADAVIGMGAVILGDVASGATVVGNPAKIL